MEGLYIIARKKARMPITVHAVPYIGREVCSLVTAIIGLSLTDVVTLELPHVNQNTFPQAEIPIVIYLLCNCSHNLKVH